MNNPPPGVKLVMSAVCIMKDIKAEKINDPAGTGQKVSNQLLIIALYLIHSLDTRLLGTS